eukprot:s2914_g2.t1
MRPCLAARLSARSLRSPRGLRPASGTPSFHQINLAYPGLEMVRSEPEIFLVHDFFSATQCERLIRKAQQGDAMVPAGVFSPQGLKRSESRTSSQCLCPQREVPSLLRKVVELLRCPPRHLEACQIIRYEAGQFFAAHGDFSSNGTRSSAGFVDCARLATLFVYLNDVERGGETDFPNAEPPLRVQPTRGLAVIHFPSSLEYVSDARRTRHQSLPAVDEKWIFATWMWSGPRSQDLELLQQLGRGYSHVWPESYDPLSADVALELLEMLLSRFSRVQPDLYSFNLALAACREQWTVVLSLLTQWRHGSLVPKLRPDVVSFNTALAAVSSSGAPGDWTRAIDLLETMREDRVPPDLQSYSRALDACSGARRWEEAVGLVQDQLPWNPPKKQEDTRKILRERGRELPTIR